MGFVPTTPCRRQTRVMTTWPGGAINSGLSLVGREMLVFLLKVKTQNVHDILTSAHARGIDSANRIDSAD